MESKKSLELSYVSVEARNLFLETDLVFMKVLEGQIQLRKNHQPQVLNEGDIVIIHPRTCFILENLGKHNLIAFFKLDRQLTMRYERGVGPRLYSGNSAKHEVCHPDLYSRLRSILLEMTKTEIFENKRAVHMHLKNLFRLLNNHFNFITCGAGHQKFTVKMHNRYDLIFRYYFKSNDNPSLKVISEKLDLNYDYLRKDIKSRYGYTFNQMKDYVRVSKAARLLIDSEISITDISYKVGFSDHKYMVDKFKKFYGLTPSELRILGTDNTNSIMSFVKIL